jgi:hypothetical protein
MIDTRSGVAGLFLATCVVHATSACADDDAVNERIQSAGRRAHPGRELCGFTSSGIEEYRASLRRSLAASADFDSQWDYGWTRAEPVLLQYQSLHASDPKDYQSRVRLVCATLRSTANRVLKSQNKDGQAPRQ